MHSMLHHNYSSHLIQHKASFSRSPHHSIILLNHKSTWSTNTHTAQHQHQHQHQQTFIQTAHQGVHDLLLLAIPWQHHQNHDLATIQWPLWPETPTLIHKQQQQHSSPNYMNLWCHTPYPDTPPPSTTPKTINIQTSGHYYKCDSSPTTHHSTCPTQNQTKQGDEATKASKRISHSFLLYPVCSTVQWLHDNWNFPVIGTGLSLCTGFSGK